MTAIEQERDDLLAALREIGELIEDLPSGIDKDAHPEDESPADTFQHIGGLIWQIVEAKLEHQRQTASE